MAKHSIHDVLADFREAASSNRDLGDRFERLMCRYFGVDPIFIEDCSRAWPELASLLTASRKVLFTCALE